MTDIVERLRELSTPERRKHGVPADVAMDEAADTITALRAENEKLWVAVKEVVNETAKHHAENLSRAKLGGSGMSQRKAKAVVARSGVLFHNIKSIVRAALGDKL